jgi:hypothetical protein
MTVPSWLVQIGSLTGLATFCFTIWDRLLSGRPLVSIILSGRHRELSFRNLSRHDVIITRIKCFPSFVAVASDDSIHGIATATVGIGFAAILKSEKTRTFPLIFKKGDLVESEATVTAPFMIVVSWRRTKSTWLPQLPAIIFSSARAMRLMENAK